MTLRSHPLFQLINVALSESIYSLYNIKQKQAKKMNEYETRVYICTSFY